MTLKLKTNKPRLIRDMVCSNCGMISSDWPGIGFWKSRTVFCCEGCAVNTGCTCESENDGDKVF